MITCIAALNTLIQLAVAEKHVGPRIEAIETRGQGMPDPNGQTLPQRAGGGFHAGQAPHVRMAFERAAELRMTEDQLVVSLKPAAQRENSRPRRAPNTGAAPHGPWKE